jgi:hypothetical protein
MSDADNIVYPNVQTTKGGGLIDFTNPIWHGNVDPYWRAIKNNDYVPMKSEQDAMWFGPNYKKYYPGFRNGKLPKFEDGKLSNYYDSISDILDFVPFVGAANRFTRGEYNDAAVNLGLDLLGPIKYVTKGAKAIKNSKNILKSIKNSSIGKLLYNSGEDLKKSAGYGAWYASNSNSAKDAAGSFIKGTI